MWIIRNKHRKKWGLGVSQKLFLHPSIRTAEEDATQLEQKTNWGDLFIAIIIIIVIITTTVINFGV